MGSTIAGSYRWPTSFCIESRRSVLSTCSEAPAISILEIVGTIWPFASTGIISINERQSVFIMEFGYARAAPLYKAMVLQEGRNSNRAGISQVCVRLTGLAKISEVERPTHNGSARFLALGLSAEDVNELSDQGFPGFCRCGLRLNGLIFHRHPE